MYKTVSNLRDSISGILTGINLNTVQNLNGALERTARELSTRISIPEASGQSQITLYDGVFDYAAPTDIFGASLVDFRPQGMSRNPNDFVQRQYIDAFDRNKAWISNGYRITFETIKGVGHVRITATRPEPRIELDPFTDTTGWTLAGSASGLTKDSTVFWQDPSSLRFTLTGASSGTLTKTIPSQDLTNYVGVGVVFIPIRIPLATSLTSMTIKIGSSASNYYTVTATTGFLEPFTANEWMLVAFDLATATTVGTPVNTAITYAQITVTHSATVANFYIGDFWIALPSPHTMYYQGTSFFQASGSNPSQTITNSADTVLLNDSALVIYEYECALTIAQQQGGTLASGLTQQIDDKLNGKRARNGMIVQQGLYDLYRSSNPSQELRLIGNYYNDA